VESFWLNSTVGILVFFNHIRSTLSHALPVYYSSNIFAGFYFKTTRLSGLLGRIFMLNYYFITLHTVVKTILILSTYFTIKGLLTSFLESWHV
tara:strand:+ start:8270 stop:8548 length:279 start_codon:yes stop_codon:yes gene_type:complete